MGKNIVGHGDEGVFLAEHGSVLTDEGQTVNIGVYDDTEIESSLAHTAHDALQVLLQGFGIVGEVAVGLAVEYLVVYAKGLEQSGKDDAADAVDGVHTDAETGLADGLTVDKLQVEHALDMALVEGVVFDIFAQMVHIGILEVLSLGNTEYLVAILLVEELSLAVEQLEGIPLAGVMGGGNDDAAVGSAHAHSQFGGGGGGESDIDDVVAIAHEGTADHILDHLAGNAGVTANDNAAAGFSPLSLSPLSSFLSPLNKGSIGGYKLHDVQWIQRIAGRASDRTTDARY